MSGWVAMHRGWRDCEAFEARRDPMADADAWFWLVEHAAWKPLRRTGGQGQSILIARGQIHVSDRSLATAFLWDKKRVRRFLDRLEAHGMIAQARDQSGTVLTLTNYDCYQQPGDAGAGPARDRPGTIQEQGKPDSASDEAAAPFDVVKAVFDLGAALLTGAGHEERAARSIVGRWRRDFGDAAVLEALLDCQARRISSPVEWMPRRLAAAARGRGGGGGSDALIAQARQYAGRRGGP